MSNQSTEEIGGDGGGQVGEGGDVAISKGCKFGCIGASSPLRAAKVSKVVVKLMLKCGKDLMPCPQKITCSHNQQTNLKHSCQLHLFLTLLARMCMGLKPGDVLIKAPAHKLPLTKMHVQA